MNGMMIGTITLSITMFFMYIIEILARFYAAPPKMMERFRTIMSLTILIQILYVMLPSDRKSLLD
jgi:hypothetical protein